MPYSRTGAVAGMTTAQRAGLWKALRRELLSGEEVRALAGGEKPVPRSTLIYWRRRPPLEHLPRFPRPVLRKGVELWSRTEVEAWLAARTRRKRWVETGRLEDA